jgi:uncharacterized protein (TIGR03435 family)
MRATPLFTGLVSIVSLASIVGSLCWAQTKQSRPVFDVASIRIVKLEQRQFPPTALRRYPERIDYSYVRLGELVRLAYDLPNYRIAWPERLDESRYELYSISATFPKGTNAAEIRGMLQELLDSRLALRTHLVKKEISAYEAKLAPGGLKMHHSDYDPAKDSDPSDPNDEAQREERNHYTIFQGREGWHITGIISMNQLTAMLGTDLGEPMVDKTGVAGYFDIDFTWKRPYVAPTLPGQQSVTGEAPVPEGAKNATLFPALEQQLGIKAERTKLAIDVLTIDSVQRVPTEN